MKILSVYVSNIIKHTCILLLPTVYKQFKKNQLNSYRINWLKFKKAIDIFSKNYIMITYIYFLTNLFTILFLNFSYMFKWKIKIYKNIDWKEERVFKIFHNEKDFNSFIEKNQDLKDFKSWEHIKWPDTLFDIKWFFSEAERLWNTDFFKEMNKELETLLEKGKKLLWK